MKKLLAKLIRTLNKMIRNGYYYPLLEKRLLRPTKIFKNVVLDCVYDETFIFRANLSDWIQHHIFFMGYYDHELSSWIKLNTKPGNTILDIGANVGAFTLLFSKRTGESGKVLAVEPFPINAASLIQNIKLNKINNVHIFLNPLGKKQELVNLEGYDSENQGLVFTKSIDSKEASSLCASFQILGDTLIESLSMCKIDIIKVDAEGHDIEILESLSNVISTSRPIIVLEFQPELKHQLVEIQNFARKFHYSIKDLKNEPIDLHFLQSIDVSEVNIILSPIVFNN